MTKIYGNLEDKGGIAKCSRRMQNGVEILETETIRMIKLEEPVEEKQSAEPRLIISDAAGKAPKFVSKSRSQLGVNRMLQSILNEPLGAK